jgi:hypothetical protein
MTEMWSNTAAPIQTGANAYRKAVEVSSFVRKREASPAMTTTR